MAVYRGGVEANTGAIARLRIILEMIKFEHTIFALPFALISMVLAARHLPHGIPPARVIAWILAAMVGARSAAMAFNRMVDAPFDADNPRTARRAIPAGLLTMGQVGLFTVVSILVLEMAAYRLNPLCFALSPIAVAALLGYSLTKRFTSLSHLALGFAIGIAPIGAWVAVQGHIDLIPLLLGAVVMLWIGGFDIIYALQDEEFDRKVGLHSLPQAIGARNALRVSRLMHVVMLGLLLVIGQLSGLHFVYFAGVFVVAGLIYYEHSLVSPDDLSKLDVAFFTLNGWISVSLLAFVVLDRVIKH